MPKSLSDILNMENLHKMIDQGYISERESGDGRYVLNYTSAAAFDRVWNNETRACRGLVYAKHFNGKEYIVARPFPKFFNLSEYLDAGYSLPTDSTFSVSDKMDGSLIIAYQWKGKVALNTRGSFVSEQAIAAQTWLNEIFPNLTIMDGDTWLMEWTSPNNRIVVSYPEDELFLLDIIYNYDGKSVFESRIKGKGNNLYGIRLAPQHNVVDINQLVGIERENKEGFVIRFHGGNNLRLKIKHDEYVKLHRILTHVTPKTIWEYLANDDSASRDALIEVAPDEFYDWIIEVEDDLKAQALQIEGKVRGEFAGILYKMLEEGSTADNPERRKHFAFYAIKSKNSAMLFALYDGNDEKFHNQIWKSLKPKGEIPFKKDEDA